MLYMKFSIGIKANYKTFKLNTDNKMRTKKDVFHRIFIFLFGENYIKRQRRYYLMNRALCYTENGFNSNF